MNYFVKYLNWRAFFVGVLGDIIQRVSFAESLLQRATGCPGSTMYQGLSLVRLCVVLEFLNVLGLSYSNHDSLVSPFIQALSKGCFLLHPTGPVSLENAHCHFNNFSISLPNLKFQWLWKI